jgi:GNAT superfamily N-acetyltransferase
MKRYIRSSIDTKDLKIRTEVWDSYGGWVTGSVVCEYNDEIIGKIDIQIGDDANEIYIDMVEVKPEYRRQGIATQMFNFLRNEFSDYYIEWGFTTPDGTRLKEALTITTKNKDYENKEKTIAILDDLLAKLESKLNDDEWLDTTPQEEILKVSDKWQLYYDKKRDLEYDLSDMREYITVWK